MNEDEWADCRRDWKKIDDGDKIEALEAMVKELEARVDVCDTIRQALEAALTVFQLRDAGRAGR